MRALIDSLWPRRLAAQLGLLLVLLLVGGTGVFGWFTSRQQARLGFGALLRSGEVLARNLASGSALALASRDYAGLEVTALGYANLPDVLSVRIFDLDGVVVSRVVRGSDGPQIVYEPVTELAAAPPDASYAVTDGGQQLTLHHPILAGVTRLGRIELELSLASSLAAQRRLLAGTFAFGVLLASLVLLVFSLLLRRPLRAVRAAIAFADTLDLRRGDSLPVERISLETEQLGEALNQVSRKLFEQELALRHSEAEAKKLALVASRTSNAVIITDAQGVTEWVNDGFVRITGFQPDEVIGRTPGSLLQGTGTDAETVRYMREQIAQQRAFEAELVNYTKSGTPYWIALEVQPIRDDRGRLTNFIAVESDVTERKEVVEALQLSERRFRAVVENLSEGLFITAPDDVVTYANPQVEAITGYSPDEFLGRRAYEILLPKEEHARAAKRNRERLEGVSERYEIEVVHKDGHRLWLDNHATPLFDADGRAIGSLGAFGDVTERKRIREQLMASEERYRELFAEAEAQRDFALTVMTTIGQGLTVVGADWTFEYVNPAYARFLGYTPEALIGTSPLALSAPDERPELERIKAERAGGKTSSYETRIRHAFGHYIDVLITGVPRFREGKLNGTISVVTDITERKQFEAELHNAKVFAETANRAKSEFLSRMSHELRTPLNAILGFTQLLEFDDDLSDDQRESVERILRAGRHLLDLINEVLDISRIESGTISFSIEPVELQTVIDESVRLIEPLAAEWGIELTVEGFEGLWVEVDAQRLKQVLLNLLSNGIKYNRRGGWVLLRGRGVEGSRVVFEVEDSGGGIAAELMPRLFTPFDRLGADRTEVEGSGIGLALAKSLVDAMHGLIGVRSEVGRGTTFSVELPRASVAEDAQPSPALVGEGTDSGWGRALRIVYIEDNLSNLLLIEKILERVAKVELLTAMQGQIGLELIAKQAPDLVLLDLNLPDLSGEQVLARLRADPSTRDIPVVVLSADATPKRIDDLLARGIEAFLTKPIDVKELLAVVQRHAVHDDDVHPGAGGSG